MRVTKKEMEARWQKLRTGLTTVFPQAGSLTVEGLSQPNSQLLSQIDDVLSRYAASAAAKLQDQAATMALRNAAKTDRALYLGLVASLKVTLGSKNAKLAHCGVAPKTPPAKPTVEAVALATARRVATRKLRNPLTKKQRAAIPPVQGLSLQILQKPDETATESPQAETKTSP